MYVLLICEVHSHSEHVLHYQEAFHVSEEIERRISLNGLAMLRFINAFFADLYSMEVIKEGDFVDTVDLLLGRIDGPLLFNLFLHDLLARALTGNGKKLSPETWRNISMHWNSIFPCGPSSYTNLIIRLFHEDAMEAGKYCALEWEVEPTGEMLTMCDALASKLGGRMWDEEMERRDLEKEQTRLVESMGDVRL